MLGFVKKVLTTSSVVSIAALATSPAFAFSITGTDFIKYEAIDTDSDSLLDTTQRNDAVDLNAILVGSCTEVGDACDPAGSPGGNVELFASSETLTLAQFLASDERTTLSQTFASGDTFTISSLTAEDWFGPVTDVGDITYEGLVGTLARTWFDGIMDFVDIQDPLRVTLFNQFRDAGGFQRFSDPNVSYANQDGTGQIAYGLAGSFDAGEANPAFAGYQASELVRLSLNGTDLGIRYSFGNIDTQRIASRSGLNSEDPTKSHDGNYETTVGGGTSVPEPSTLLGLIGMAGLVAAKRKANKHA
jgi:hypothetical protein